jgi:hypothetical protein
MSTITISRPNVNPTEAVDLLDRMARQRFFPGAPDQVTELSRTIDRLACSSRRCETCDNRGLEYHPFHNGRRYRVLAVCVRCGAAAEF